MTLLAARDLSLNFEGLRALGGVDLELDAGEVHGLVGPNGSGKSTLLRCISGALKPDSGSVTMSGTLLNALTEAERVREGVVRTFQRTAVIPHLSVAEHVDVGFRLRYRYASWAQALLKTPAYRAEVRAGTLARDALLRTFGLIDHARAMPHTLSGGRQRLLQMATAVATGPRVLLLDEPSSGMSQDEIGLLHSALAELARDGLAILLIEHNMRFLRGIASEVTVLDGGVLVARGTPAQVVDDPKVKRAYLGRAFETVTSDAPTLRRRSRRRSSPVPRPGPGPTPAGVRGQKGGAR